MTDPKSQVRPWREVIVALVAGCLFSAGLAIAGMLRPEKVVAFLDVTGNWDPSLAFVMLGAIAVYATASRLAEKRSAPLAGGCFHLPTRRDIDSRLVLGAALFGIGWGLAGYCPGPGLASLGARSMGAITFVAAMAAGTWLFESLRRTRSAGRSSDEL